MQLQFTFRSQLTATVRSFDSSLKLPGMEGGGGGGGEGEGEEKGAWQEILVSPRTFRPGSVSTLLESLSSAFQIFKSSFNTAICKDPVYSCPPPPQKKIRNGPPNLKTASINVTENAVINIPILLTKF